MIMPLTLRCAQPEDAAFLFDLYASTRAEEMAAWGWDAAQQQAFLKFQFTAQQQHYESLEPEPDQQIVLRDDRAIGRLIVVRGEQEILLADIALLPEYRNAGIGTQLIQGLQAKAAQANNQVRLHVEKSNRARRLYERLGFQIVGDAGMHWQMEWHPTDRV